MRRTLLFSLFFVLLFGVDFFSKAYVHHFLPLMGYGAPFYPYGGIAVFEDFGGIDFSINHVMNKGAAWGMLANFHQALFYARLALIGVLFIYLLFFAQRRAQLPLLMVITGALGNIFDNIIYGHVVDMFYFRFWGHSFPVFNVADSAIFCGIVWLFLQSYFKSRKPLAAHE